ncbi:hypothetical protein J2R96_008170 [Bradyrhizobium elkanii]|nr:hypothetical protein [Bradyrhizobium elkanii]
MAKKSNNQDRAEISRINALLSHTLDIQASKPQSRAERLASAEHEVARVDWNAMLLPTARNAKAEAKQVKPAKPRMSYPTTFNRTANSRDMRLVYSEMSVPAERKSTVKPKATVRTAQPKPRMNRAGLLAK